MTIAKLLFVAQRNSGNRRTFLLALKLMMQCNEFKTEFPALVSHLPLLN